MLFHSTHGSSLHAEVIRAASSARADRQWAFSKDAMGCFGAQAWCIRRQNRAVALQRWAMSPYWMHDPLGPA